MWLPVEAGGSSPSAVFNGKMSQGLETWPRHSCNPHSGDPSQPWEGSQGPQAPTCRQGTGAPEEGRDLHQVTEQVRVGNLSPPLSRLFPLTCLLGKNQCRRPRLSPWVGRLLGEGNGNPLQSSCLENSIDRGACCC